MQAYARIRDKDTNKCAQKQIFRKFLEPEPAENERRQLRASAGRGCGSHDPKVGQSMQNRSFGQSLRMTVADNDNALKGVVSAAAHAVGVPPLPPPKNCVEVCPKAECDAKSTRAEACRDRLYSGGHKA